MPTNRVLLAIFIITFSHLGLSVTSFEDNFIRFFQIQNPKKLTVLNINAYQQTTDYTCGPAVLMSLLHYYQILDDKQLNQTTELQIAKELGASSAKGSSLPQMVAWLRQHGFTVQAGTNGTLKLLQANLKKKIPILVEWIDWGGHWVIVSGYYAGDKRDKGTLYLADPSAKYDNVPSMQGLISFNAERFESMWFDAQYCTPGQLMKGIYIIAVPLPQKEKP